MPAIRLTGFTKVYGDVRAVDGLDLEIGAGETWLLLGRNGSGKSTTLRAVAGLLSPTAGAVAVFGEDPRRGSPAIRRRIGYLPQRASFPPALTGREILAFYSRIRRLPEESGDDALGQAGLGDAADRPCGTYSGGMLQRLSLAVALLGDPDLLLLDEPMMSLDEEGRARLFRHLEVIRGRRAALVTTHVLEELSGVADAAAVLIDGALAEVSRPGRSTPILLSDTISRLAERPLAVSGGNRQ